MGFLNVIDRIVDGLASDSFPDDVTRQLDWLCSREQPSPEDQAKAMDFCTFGYRRLFEAPGEMWQAIHREEASRGRTAHDFVQRFGLGGLPAGQNIDLDYIAEQHALEAERSAFEQRQAEASAAFQERAQAAERASTHRQYVARHRARLAELQSLAAQIDAERAGCLEGLRELFDPSIARHESVSDLQRIVQLHSTIQACDAASKSLPSLVKLAESRLAAFEKSFPTK